MKLLFFSFLCVCCSTLLCPLSVSHRSGTLSFPPTGGILLGVPEKKIYALSLTSFERSEFKNVYN